MIKRLIQFKSVDEVLAETALKTMENHYWYLCGPVLLFALFSSLVSDEEKQNIAQKLLSLEKPTAIKFGKPEFPEEVGLDTVLSDLVTAARAGGFLTAARLILGSCRCLWRIGRPMISSWRRRSLSRR